MATTNDGWWGTRRAVAPPEPVWVSITRVLPPSRVSSGDVPLRVRASAIDTSMTVPGQLVAWHQTLTGEWWALTTFEMTNRNGRARLEVTQLVPADAVRPQ